ncbi:hypothetical protein CYMTET_54457, partial [Cymbomonas tetramitiformis]
AQRCNELSLQLHGEERYSLRLPPEDNGESFIVPGLLDFTRPSVAQARTKALERAAACISSQSMMTAKRQKALKIKAGSMKRLHSNVGATVGIGAASMAPGPPVLLPPSAPATPNVATTAALDSAASTAPGPPALLSPSGSAAPNAATVVALGAASTASGPPVLLPPSGPAAPNAATAAALGAASTAPGGSKLEDLSCKRQFDVVDAADSFFFKAKAELDSLSEEGFSENGLRVLEEVNAKLEAAMKWSESQAQIFSIAFQYG